MASNTNVVDQIKRSTRLSDYINQFTIAPLKRSGGEGKWIGFCPLHDNTKSPAFSVDDNKGLWKCFSNCGGGSIIDFWLVQHGYDAHDRGGFGMAIEGLAAEMSIELPEYKSEKKGISPTKIKSVLKDVSKAATDYLLDGESSHKYLQDDEKDDSEVAYNYLIDRGFTDELIIKYGIGFFPSTNRATVKLITKAAGDEYGLKAAVAGGVANQSNDGGSVFTSLYGRIVIPITDRFGNVLGFGAREVPDVAHYGEGKWVNPSATPVYDKSKTLFDGGELSRTKNPKSVVICEGYFDAIAVTESESDSIGMAVCGTATTPSHIEMLGGVDEITFMFDGDDAGMKATSSLTWALNKREDLFAILLPDGIDPFDVVFSKSSDVTISSLIAEAKPLLKVAVDAERDRRPKNDDFDKWVANAMSAISSEKHKNEFAALAASKRGQNKSAYIRNISRINVAGIKFDDVESTSIDANSAALIAFVMALPDEEKDALFYSLDDDEIITVLSQWLSVSSDLAIATFTSVLFGESFIDEVSKRDIDKEIAALMLNPEEDSSVDIERPLKSSLAIITSHAKPAISGGSVSGAFAQRLVGIRDLVHLSSIKGEQAAVLSVIIDLAVDLSRLKSNKE